MSGKGIMNLALHGYAMLKELPKPQVSLSTTSKNTLALK